MDSLPRGKLSLQVIILIILIIPQSQDPQDLKIKQFQKYHQTHLMGFLSNKRMILKNVQILPLKKYMNRKTPLLPVVAC